MSGQAKSHLFGCNSTHKFRKRQPELDLTPEQFIALEETQAYLSAHPESISYEDGQAYLCPTLCDRYLQLLGNKRLRKLFRRKTKL